MNSQLALLDENYWISLCAELLSNQVECLKLFGHQSTD